MQALKHIVVVILFGGLIGCSKDKPEIKEEKPIQIQKFKRSFQGKGVIKAKYIQGHYFVLLEKLPPAGKCPGERSIELLNLAGATITAISNNSSAIIDADFDNEFVYLASIVSTGGNESVIVEKIDTAGNRIKTATILEEAKNLQVYDDRIKIIASKHNIYMAIFKNDETTYLFSLDISNLHEKWTLLIEPAVHRMPWAMNGGSYDDFGQMAHQYTVYLDADEAGNAYVAIPVMGGAITTTLNFHNKYFGESLTLKSSNSGMNTLPTDALVTKVSSGGQRIYSSVMGTVYHDEIHGMQVFQEKIITYGRCPITGFDDWDPYMSVNDTRTGSELFARNYDATSNGMFLAAGYDTLASNYYLGGVVDWSQNPSGVSVSEQGNKLLLTMNDQNGAPGENIVLTNGPRQNQIRSIQILGDNLFLLGGWENGPGTHSGDGNPDLVFADGFLEVR